MRDRVNGSRTAVGVLGVGTMGQHHARVYDELSDVDLVGVYDVDVERASTVAARHGTHALDLDTLLRQADAVSVAVPTQYHHDVTQQCIDRGVHALVEKPFVLDPSEGEALIAAAERNDVTLQVGHVERFNPAVRVLEDILPELDIISINTERLGPPPERTINDSAVLDLMIHDIDIILSLIDEDPAKIDATGVHGNRCVTASFGYESDIYATLTASRLTQKKVRRLEVTAESCYVIVDYIDSTVEIHRQSVPEYIRVNGDVRYRHEGIVERPVVQRGEPLKNELESFVEAVRTGATPEVTAGDGLRAMEVALEIEAKAQPLASPAMEVSPQ